MFFPSDNCWCFSGDGAERLHRQSQGLSQINDDNFNIYLELVLVYMSGVLAGSLGTSLTDPDTYLAGASGGGSGRPSSSSLWASSSAWCGT